MENVDVQTKGNEEETFFSDSWKNACRPCSMLH